ncbi:hypothetical protein [Croceitalea rosinachiae]|uniref:Membrane metalloprotease n=1 Tax=Croceitalea rosinachiae TaxID=3075596 RepID=A0ABU3ACT4_9FLAO|nr:hypothetical protein [Croceitalea sp. F388]MDT0607992.1 hypothetical protein [Croceitalea sp. F388]
MNKRSIYFLAISTLIFIACSSNDNEPTDPADDGPTQVDKSQNLLATGASANDILSNARFDKLLIEATYAPGFRPTDEAMNNFQDYLRTHTFKTDIEIEYREIDATGEESLTLEEIDDLEQENRTAYNDGTTLAIYIFFADAPSEGDNLDEGLVTVGAVYRNTSMIIYEKTVKTLADRSFTITTADVETATLNHEFGHLFGLVNLGTVPVNDHEDPEAENHCNVDPCLMRAELEFGQVNRAFSAIHNKSHLHSSCSLNGEALLKQMELQVSRGNAATPGLDPECRLDLESNGGRPSTES